MIIILKLSQALSRIHTIATWGISNFVGSLKSDGKSGPNVVGGPSLKKGLSLQFLGNLSFAICQWGTVVVLAKFGGTEFVGDYSLAQAFVLPVLEAGNANLRVIQATDVRREYELPDYLGFRICTLGASLLVTLCIVQMSTLSVATQMFMLMFAVSKAIDGITDTFFGWFQLREQHGRIALARALLGVMQLMSLICLLTLSRSLPAAASGFLAGSIIVVSFVYINSYRQVATTETINAPLKSILPRWKRKSIFGIARHSLPMGIMTGCGIFNIMIPRLILEAYRGTAQLGEFSAMVYCNQVSSLAFNSCYHAALPRLARYYAESMKAFQSLLLRLMLLAFAIGFAGVLGAYFFGRQILELLFRPEFARSPEILVYLTWGGLFTHIGNSIIAGLHASRQFRIQPVLTGALLIFTTLSCFWLIPIGGATGAAIASLIGTGLWVLLSGSFLFAHIRTTVVARQTEAASMVS